MSSHVASTLEHKTRGTVGGNLSKLRDFANKHGQYLPDGIQLICEELSQVVVGFSDYLALVRFFRDRSPLFFDGSMFNNPGGFPLPVILEWNDARHLTSKGLI